MEKWKMIASFTGLTLEAGAGWTEETSAARHQALYSWSAIPRLYKYTVTGMRSVKLYTEMQRVNESNPFFYLSMDGYY